MPATFNMSDVMISYSRRDKAFVQRLNQSLQDSGRAVWVDWEDIPPTADWWSEIQAGIEAAHTFVFIISPESVRSEICRREIDHAIACNKRLVPVLYKEIVDEADKAKMHPTLNTHNWIYLRDTDDFVAGFKILVLALETDLQHVQTHTRLLVRANEWEFKKRPNSLLLRGEDLKDAEHWLRHGHNKKPNPTELQADYIEASRAAANRFRTTVIGAMSAALVILSLLACFAFSQANLAQTALSESNDRGTQVVLRLTDVAQQAATSQANANLAATNAANAFNNAETSVAEAATSAYNATQSANNAATATNAQGDAENNLLTATNAQGEAEINGTLAAENANQESTAAALAAENEQTAIAAAATSNYNATQSAINANQAETEAANAVNSASTAAAEANQRATQQAIAQQQESIAQTQAAIANANATLSAQNAATANANATQAQNEANQRATQQAIAEREAEVAQSLALAANARAALAAGDRPLAMHLALLAANIPDPPAQIELALDSVAYSLGVRNVMAGHIAEVNDVAFSPDGSKAISGGCGEFGSEGTYIGVRCQGGEMIMWDVNRGLILGRFTAHERAVHTVAFSPNGSMALSGGCGELSEFFIFYVERYCVQGEIILWDITTGGVIRRFLGHEGSVLSVGFSSDGQKIVSSGCNPEYGGGYYQCEGGEIIVWNITDGSILHTLHGHSHSVNSAVFSPDGSRILSGSEDGSVILWELETETPIQLQDKTTLSPVNSVAFSPETPEDLIGGRYAAAGVGGEIFIWDTTQLSPITSTLLASQIFQINDIAFSPDGKTLLAGSADNTLSWWDVASGGELIYQFTGHSSNVLSVAFSPLSTWESPAKHFALSGSVDSRVILWDLHIPSFELAHFDVNSEIWDVAFSPKTTTNPAGGNLVLFGGFSYDNDPPGGYFELWNSTTGTLFYRSNPYRSYIVSVAISPDGTKAAFGMCEGYTGNVCENQQGQILLWDINRRSEINRLYAHVSPAWTVAFSPDGTKVISGGCREFLNLQGSCQVGDAIVWDVISGAQLMTLTGHTRDVKNAAFSPDGRRIVTGANDGMIVIWDAQTGAELRRFRILTGPVESVTFSPKTVTDPNGGRFILAGMEDATVIMWDATTGVEVRRFTGHTSAVSSVKFSSDGRRIASSEYNRLIIIWDVDSGEIMRRFVGHTNGISNVDFRADGNRLVSGSYDQTIRIWDIVSFSDLKTWTCAVRYARPLTATEKQLYVVTDAQIQKLAQTCDASKVTNSNQTVLVVASVGNISIDNGSTSLQLTTETPTPDALLPEIIESDDAWVVATGGWQRMDAVEASGRSYLITGNVGDSLSLTFEGTGVAFVYLSHPAMGNLSVELDGVVGETIGLAEGQPELTTYTISGLAFGTHTLRLMVTQGPAVVDAFIVNPTPENPEVTPEVTAEATMEVTAEVTLEVTFTETPTLEPTLTATPTLEPILPTATLMLPPIAPPLFASMDDGAPFWTARGGWRLSDTLRYSEIGLGWFAAPEMSTLTWEQPLDLRLSAAPQLRFMSLLNAANGSLAAVEISTDGANWIMQAVVAPSALWQETALDLSAYRGQVIWIRFTWLWQAAATADAPIDFWVLDAVSAVDVPPVIPTFPPTATVFIEVIPTAIMTPTLTLAPVVEVTPEITGEATGEATAETLP